MTTDIFIDLFSFNIRTEILKKKKKKKKKKKEEKKKKEKEEKKKKEKEEEEEEEKKKLLLMVFNNIPCSGILYRQLPFSALIIPPVPNGLNISVCVCVCVCVWQSGREGTCASSVVGLQAIEIR